MCVPGDLCTAVSGSTRHLSSPLPDLALFMLGPSRGQDQGPESVRALWLAGYEHGSRRRCVPNSRSRSRVRCLLPPEPWLQQRLEEHGLMAQLHIAKHGRANVVCKALVLVDQGICLSTLAARRLEVELLWRYLGRPLDLFTLRVQRCWLLSDPAPVHTRRRVARKIGNHSSGLSEVACVTVGGQGVIWNADDLCQTRVVQRGHATPLCAQDALQDCGMPEDGFGNIPTLLVVQPVLSLVERGVWSDLVCLARWGLQLWSRWPPHDWELEVRGRDWGPPPGHKLGIAELSSLASDLRQWAPAIAGSPSLIVCLCVCLLVCLTIV